jgi:DNA polymerase III epsilon subunit-like protein
MNQMIFSARALDVLKRSQEIQKDLEFCSKDGELTQQIRRFVRSLEGPLRSQLKLEQWTCTEEREGSSFIWLNLFPETWRLHGDEFVAFGVSWCNPFEEEAEDPYVFVRTPTLDAFPGRNNLLKKLRPALVERGFEDSPDAEPYWPIWKHVSLEAFRSSSSFDVDALVLALVETFGRLLPGVPIIDGFFQSLPAAKRVPQIPQPERHLKLVAFLDTETAGTPPNAKMTELAIILAAYDEIGDQIVGVVEECSLKKPKPVDQSKVQALLERAEVTVAHNCAFDRAVLQREMPGAEKHRWLCSYRDIDWKALNGVAAENLQALLHAEGLRSGQDHHALDDARDLLRLLAVQRNGQTYLARLLKKARSAKA